MERATTGCSFFCFRNLKERFELRATTKWEKRLSIVFSDDRSFFATFRFVFSVVGAKKQEENLSTPAKKEVTFVYQKLLLFLSKPQAWYIITTQSCISPAPLGLYIITRQRVYYLRLDDIQCSALMIYRNKLRMIYKATP